MRSKASFLPDGERLAFLFGCQSLLARTRSSAGNFSPASCRKMGRCGESNIKVSHAILPILSLENPRGLLAMLRSSQIGTIGG